MTEPNSHRRLVVIGVLVLALFAGLLTRLWFLQVTGGEKLAVAAQRQRDRFVQVPAMRGTIYDRNGTVLAQTVPVTTLTVDRQKLIAGRTRDAARRTSARCCGKTPADIDKLIDNPKYAPFDPVPVAKDVDLRPGRLRHRAPRPVPRGVGDPHRRAALPATTSRPPTSSATSGRSTPTSSPRTRATGYQATRHHREDRRRADLRVGAARHAGQGQGRGRQPGPRGQRRSTVKQPEAGHDVRLTVDLPTQHDRRGVAGAGHGRRAHAGRPRQRQLLRGQRRRGGRARRARPASVVAMASNPSFDPNDFITGNADQYFNDPNYPLINRALNAVRARARRSRPITSIAMLQSGLFPDGAEHTSSPTTRDGCFRFGNDEKRVQRGRARCSAPVDLPSALTVSSDVYFYTVGNEFWNALPRRGPGQGRPHRRPRRRRAPRRRAPGRQRDPAHRAHATGSASRPASGSATRPA